MLPRQSICCRVRVVGWSTKAEMNVQLVTDALLMAIWRRGRPDALLHHSDRGSQGGFKWSSQHGLCRLVGETGQAPLRVSSNQVSFGAAS
jgi:putative transposase